MGTTQKKSTCNFEKLLEATSYKTAAEQPLTTQLKIYSSKTKTKCRPLLGEVNRTQWKRFHGLLRIDAPVFADQ